MIYSYLLGNITEEEIDIPEIVIMYQRFYKRRILKNNLVDGKT